MARARPAIARPPIRGGELSRIPADFSHEGVTVCCDIARTDVLRIGRSRPL